jgi:hypothetical protein
VIFGPEREEVAGGWRSLHDELHNLFALLYIVRMIKSRRMRLAGIVAQMEEMGNSYKVVVIKPEGKRTT